MDDPAKYGSLINYDTLLIRITQTGKFKVYEAQRITRSQRAYWFSGLTTPLDL